MNEEYDFPPELLGGVWHSTSNERYLRILETGAILPEPDIPDNERYGPKKYPVVRSIGGVSLFDFRMFNAQEYGDEYGSTWSAFTPDSEGTGSIIWLEIDTAEIVENFIAPKVVMDKWKKSKEYRQIMALIEAAHIGEIPVSMIKRVLKYCKYSDEFIELKNIVG